MFAQPAALPNTVLHALGMPLPMLVAGYADSADAPNTPDDRQNISPYLQRPLRRLEEVEKARGPKPPEKDATVTDRR